MVRKTKPNSTKTGKQRSKRPQPKAKVENSANWEQVLRGNGQLPEGYAPAPEKASTKKLIMVVSDGKIQSVFDPDQATCFWQGKERWFDEVNGSQEFIFKLPNAQIVSVFLLIEVKECEFSGDLEKTYSWEEASPITPERAVAIIVDSGQRPPPELLNLADIVDLASVGHQALAQEETTQETTDNNPTQETPHAVPSPDTDDRVNKSPATEVSARGPSGKIEWLVKAMFLVRDNPDWPDQKIAKEVGKNKSTLSRNRYYKNVAAIARDRDKGFPRRGHQKLDENGQMDIEAYDGDLRKLRKGYRSSENYEE